MMPIKRLPSLHDSHSPLNLRHTKPWWHRSTQHINRSTNNSLSLPGTTNSISSISNSSNTNDFPCTTLLAGTDSVPFFLLTHAIDLFIIDLFLPLLPLMKKLRLRVVDVQIPEILRR